jgi:hypothetical protein
MVLGEELGVLRYEELLSDEMNGIYSKVRLIIMDESIMKRF